MENLICEEESLAQIFLLISSDFLSVEGSLIPVLETFHLNRFRLEACIIPAFTGQSLKLASRTNAKVVLDAYLLLEVYSCLGLDNSGFGHTIFFIYKVSALKTEHRFCAIPYHKTDNQSGICIFQKSPKH